LLCILFFPSSLLIPFLSDYLKCTSINFIAFL
jgi:hypothetical protein